MYSAFPLKEAVLFLLAFWAGKNYSSRACTWRIQILSSSVWTWRVTCKYQELWRWWL